MLCSHTKLHYSQTTFEDLNMFFRFAPLQNYTTLKRSKIQWLVCVGFAPLQNYTTLKLGNMISLIPSDFAPIQNYTTLKHRHMCILYSSLLCTHTKLHYSQTCSRVDGVKAKLYTPTKLHYSQTRLWLQSYLLELYTHTKLHYSQTNSRWLCERNVALYPYKITLLSNLKYLRKNGLRTICAIL